MKNISWSKVIFNLSLLLCGASLLLAGIEIFSYSQQENRRLEIAKDNAKEEAVRAKTQIEAKLRKLQDTANSIAGDLTEGKLKDDQLLERVKKELEENPDFSEIGAAYEPFAYKRNRRLYGPYYSRITGKLKQLQVENFYDYTTPNNLWYYGALTKGSLWGEPDFDNSANTILAEYDTAFYRVDQKTKQKKAVGVIFANYTLDALKYLIDSLDIGKSGYGFLISQKGVLLAHPNQILVKQQKTIFNLATSSKNDKLRVLGEKAIKGESDTIEFIDDMTGQAAWIFIEPIPLTGWSLGIVVIKDDSYIDSRTRRQDLIRIALEIITFLFFLSILIFRVDRGRIKSLWIASSIFSILCVVDISLIWYLAISSDDYKINRNLIINKRNVDNLLKPQIELAANLKQKPPAYVPTGVFIQAVKFNTANDVFVSGYIWQKFQDGADDDLSRGLLLPEGNDIDITQAYSYKKNGIEVIGWYFEATLRQNFDFSKYPFDYNDVWVRLWPQSFNSKDLNRTVILVPDLSSYDTIDPFLKPGLEKDFVSEGWNIDSSFFEYKFNSYDTNFGIEGVAAKKNYPELYFTIIFKRAFIGILIARIVPLSVISMLLFAMKLLSRERGMEVVGACSGFIFIVILDQINLRGQVAAKGIIYFEYFYFVIYLLILIVAINAMFLNSKSIKINLIQYEDNLIPKLFYWPTLTSILLIITVLMFY